MPAARVARWVRGDRSEAFDELAVAAFRFQAERVEPLRMLCARQGLDPASLRDWRQIPLVPTLGFKSLDLCAGEPREVFRSSGTRGSGASVHRHPFPELYRDVIDATFPAALLPRIDPPPALSLVPSREQAPDSSLAFMVDHAMARWCGRPSVTAIGAGGVTTKIARSWLAGRQRDGRPALILATAFALAQLLEALERIDLRFRMPAGSRIFETGGFKGRRRELGRGDLLARIAERLAIAPRHVVREYGMTELTSHFYTRALDGGDPDLFVPPPWTRVRILSPETLAEAPAGSPGLIAVLDLANLGSALHVLTEDLGVAEADGFRLAGRAAGAELRGCSLAAEELAS